MNDVSGSERGVPLTFEEAKAAIRAEKKRSGRVRTHHDRKCPVCHVNLTRAPECQDCFDKRVGPGLILRARVLVAEAWNGDEDFFDYFNGGLEVE